MMPGSRVLLRALKGRPVSKGSVFSLKEAICGVCGESAVRFPAFPVNTCGMCLTLARDLMVDWAKLKVHDSTSVYDTIDRVVSRVSQRHPSKTASDLQEFYDEFSEANLELIRKSLVALPEFIAVVPETAFLDFSQRLCDNREDGDSLCKGEFNSMTKSLQHQLTGEIAHTPDL